MRLRLAKLQRLDKIAQKIKIKSLDEYKKFDKILHYQRLLFIYKNILTKFVSRYHNNLLIDYFDINKIKQFIDWRYS